jgi:CRP-like cAMP-binding protein
MLRYRSGKMSLAELQSSPEQHRLTQVLGAGLEIDVDTAEVALADDDILVLCSDGLFLQIPDDGIAERIDARDLEASARKLANEASRDLRHDDVSVILVKVGSERDTRSIEDIAKILRAVFLFRDLTDQDRLVIAPYMEERVYKRGEVLAREGEQGDEFFVLVDGTVRITRGRAHLVDIGPGGHLGELSLTRPTPRSATATALSRVRLFVLSRDSFDALIRRRPGLGARLALALLDTVGDRLRDLTERLSMVERVTRGDLQVPGMSPLEAVQRAARGELHEP